MADKDSAQMGWGDEKTVVVQTPNSGGQGLMMMLMAILLVSLAITGFFGWQWIQAGQRIEAMRAEYSTKENDLKLKLAEQEAFRRAETAYATALQAENAAIREGKAPPPTTVSPMQDWIDRMRAENEQRRFCVANPRNARCRGPIPTTAPPPAGVVVFGKEE